MGSRIAPNADNLSAKGQPVSVAEEPMVFVTRAEVEALVQREKERASSTAACLSFRPLYPTSIASISYHVGYTVQTFQKLYERKGNTREQITRFIDAMRPFAHDLELCLQRVLRITQGSRIYLVN